jgi:outer membrane protein assembly factor BamB
LTIHPAKNQSDLEFHRKLYNIATKKIRPMTYEHSIMLLAKTTRIARITATSFLALSILSSIGTGSACGGWGQFRGPGGDGQTTDGSIPIKWSESENIRWRADIHDIGWSSPVVSGNQIWLTTATEDGRELFAMAFDLDSGKIIHDIKVFDITKPQNHMNSNSYASPTPVIESGLVYVHFGTHGTACLDTKTGNKLWERTDLHCEHQRGPGSSPIIWKDLLIFHMDGMDKHYAIALDKKTGKTVWRCNRSIDFGDIGEDRKKAYCTPTITNFRGRDVMISVGAGAIYGLDPSTGRELWRLDNPGGFSNTSRPLVDDGLTWFTTGFGSRELWAVRLGGSGNVTKTHLTWKLKKNAPIVPSFVLVENRLFIIDDRGIASCVNAKTGELIWRQRIGGRFYASPLFAPADGDRPARIYFSDRSGKTTVIRAADKYEPLGVNELPDDFNASPAVVDGTIILRANSALYRIENQISDQPK